MVEKLGTFWATGNNFEFRERGRDQRCSVSFSNPLSVWREHSENISPSPRHKSLYLDTFRSKVPIPRLAMSQFPATVKAITFSKIGDVDVIEKTDRPFPQQGPGDVILKVRAIIVPPQLTVTHLVVRLSMPVSTSSTPTSGVDFTPYPSPQSSDRKPPE